jgi:hypothetical protein
VNSDHHAKTNTGSNNHNDKPPQPSALPVNSNQQCANKNKRKHQEPNNQEHGKSHTPIHQQKQHCNAEPLKCPQLPADPIKLIESNLESLMKSRREKTSLLPLLGPLRNNVIKKSLKTSFIDGVFMVTFVTPNPEHNFICYKQDERRNNVRTACPGVEVPFPSVLLITTDNIDSTTLQEFVYDALLEALTYVADLTPFHDSVAFLLSKPQGLQYMDTFLPKLTFHSLQTGEMTSLSTYVSRKRLHQRTIWLAITSDLPEVFKKKGFGSRREVLLVPNIEYLLHMNGLRYKGYQLKWIRDA